jgi:ABC-type transporter Mla maintaining outer membrane lipid asymmetry permease subunit MlaE
LYDFEKDKDKRNKILIDALEIMGINSSAYLIMPKMLLSIL